MSDLEIALAAMAQHGKPLLTLHDRGWVCWLKMHVVAIGASVEVTSEHGHATPTAAALECNARMQALLRGHGAGQVKALTHG